MPRTAREVDRELLLVEQRRWSVSQRNANRQRTRIDGALLRVLLVTGIYFGRFLSPMARPIAARGSSLA